MAPSTANTGDTTTILITDRNYSITKLHGQEDYQIWRIQMEDMFEEVELMDIVDGSTARSAATDVAIWDKKNKAALGALRRRVDSGPMTHVVRCTTVADAWSILKNQYQSLGVAAMTLLHNKFTSLRMGEADNLEHHIKELRSIFNDLNIALIAESSDPHKEIEFVRQLLVSLPESWQILVSVIPQRPESNDPNGTKLSADIQSRLLAEYHRRESELAEKVFYANNRNSFNRSRNPNRPNNALNRPRNSNRFNGSFDRSDDPDNSDFTPADYSNRSNVTCHNCGISGHIRPVCRKPGGGAYKGKNRQFDNNQNWRNEDQGNNDDNNQEDNFDDNNHTHDNHNQGPRVHFASSSHFAFAFAPFDHHADLLSQDRPFVAQPDSPITQSFDLVPDLTVQSCAADIFPQFSPDPMSIDIHPPISDFEEPEVPVVVLAPSEGEIDVVSHTSVEALTADTSTRHEDSPDTVLTAVAAQGEQFPMPALILNHSPTVSEPVLTEVDHSFFDLLRILTGYIIFWFICYRFTDIVLATLLLEAYIVPHIRAFKRTFIDCVRMERPSIIRSDFLLLYTVTNSIISRLSQLFPCSPTLRVKGESLISEDTPDDNPFIIHDIFDIFDRIYKSFIDHSITYDLSTFIDIDCRYTIGTCTRIKLVDITADFIRLAFNLDAYSFSFISTNVNLVNRLKFYVADPLA